MAAAKTYHWGGGNGGKPCRKGTNMSIAIIPPSVLLCLCARTGGQRKMIGRPMNTPVCRWPATPTPTTRKTSAGCWPTACRSSRTWRAGPLVPCRLNRLKETLAPGDCVKVAALDRPGRSVTEVVELLGWLREKQVEVISLRESIDQGQRHGAGDAAPSHRFRGDGARLGSGENAGGAGASQGDR